MSRCSLGFRPTTDPVKWIASIGVIGLLVLALNWLAVAVGLLAKNAEGTAGFGIIVQVLPFVSSAFVTPESMPGAVRWFAVNEPFTPIINTMRGLLMGTPDRRQRRPCRRLVRRPRSGRLSLVASAVQPGSDPVS